MKLVVVAVFFFLTACLLIYQLYTKESFVCGKDLSRATGGLLTLRNACGNIIKVFHSYVQYLKYVLFVNANKLSKCDHKLCPSLSVSETKFNISDNAMSKNWLDPDQRDKFRNIEYFQNPSIQSQPAPTRCGVRSPSWTFFEALINGIVQHQKIYKGDYLNSTNIKPEFRLSVQHFLMNPNFFVRNLERVIVIHGITNLQDGIFLKLVIDEVVKIPGKNFFKLTRRQRSKMERRHRTYPKIFGKSQNVISKYMLSFILQKLKAFLKSLNNPSNDDNSCTTPATIQDKIVNIQSSWLKNNRLQLQNPLQRLELRKAYNYYITTYFLRKYNYIPSVGRMSETQQRKFLYLLQTMPSTSQLLRDYRERCQKSIYAQNFERLQKIHDKEMDIFFQSNPQFQFQTL